MTKTFFVFGLSALMITNAQAKTKIIAHRGFWDMSGSSQNSIASLQKADSIGVYGAEFDVHVTKDGVAVLNHDFTINGIDVQQNNYDAIKDIKLSNGERLPTLEEYLDASAKAKKTKLVLEIKPHKSLEADQRAVDIVMKIVKQKKAEKRTEYISFSADICKAIIAKDAKATVAYLKGDISPADLKKMGYTGLDYNYKIFQQHPEWIDEAHRLGLEVNVWTVNDAEEMKEMIGKKVDYITTDNPVLLQSLKP